MYGKDVADNILDVDYTYEDIRVTGVIGKPEIARSNRANQLFFVNKRFIKDRILTSSAERGYKNILTPGKYGFLVLNLEMDPSKVDVNVHPAKLEVRFEEETKVFKAVYHAIQDALVRSQIIKDTEIDKNIEFIKPKEYTNVEEKKEEVSVPVVRPWEEKSSIEKLESINPTFGALFKKIVENTKQDINYSINSNEEPKNDVQDVKEEYKENTVEENTSVESKEDGNINDCEPETAEESGIEQKNIEDNQQENNSISSELEEKAPEEKSSTEDIVETVEAVQDVNEVEEKYETEPVVKQKSFEENMIETVLKTAHEKDYFDDSYKVMGLENKNETAEGEETTENQVKKNDDEITNGEKEIDEKEQNISENTESSEMENQNLEEKSEEVKKNENQEDMENIIEKMNELKDTRMDSDNSNFDEMYAKMFGTLPKKEEIKNEEDSKEDDTYKVDEESMVPTENISVFEYDEYKTIPAYQFIGVAFNELIIIQIDKQMYIIDELAARERVMYEKIKRNYYTDGPKESQIMLLPDIIDLSGKQMLIVKDNIQLFENAGFTLEEFGENTIKVTGVPDICIDLETKILFIEMLEEINTVARTAKKEIEEKFIWTLACKVAEKQEKKLEKDAVDGIMQELLRLDNPFAGEDGNPVAIKMSKVDIEKKFSRRK